MREYEQAPAQHNKWSELAARLGALPVAAAHMDKDVLGLGAIYEDMSFEDQAEARRLFNLGVRHA